MSLHPSRLLTRHYRKPSPLQSAVRARSGHADLNPWGPGHLWRLQSEQGLQECPHQAGRRAEERGIQAGLLRQAWREP